MAECKIGASVAVAKTTASVKYGYGNMGVSVCAFFFLLFLYGILVGDGVLGVLVALVTGSLVEDSVVGLIVSLPGLLVRNVVIINFGMIGPFIGLCVVSCVLGSFGQQLDLLGCCCP